MSSKRSRSEGSQREPISKKSTPNAVEHEPQSVSYIISKEGDKFLQIPSKNSGNIKLGKYIQSGGFASVYSIKNNPKLVCRITHTSLTYVDMINESRGLRIQYELSSVHGLNNIVKIYGYGLYQVSDTNVADDYCIQRPRDWCQGQIEEVTKRYKHFSGEGNEGIYAVMERIKADLFDYYVSPGRELNIEEEIEFIHSIFLQLMTVVIHLHKAGYVHRDIKPENIGIVFEEGKIKIKLFDFGYAVNTRELTGVSRAGTPGYFDEGLYDPSTQKLITSIEDLEFSDVYACGISIFFMIAIILNDTQAFNIFKDNKDSVIKRGMIERLKEASKRIENKKKQKKILGMLEAISGCVGLRERKFTEEEILEQLLQLHLTSGGKKKTKKKKNKKNKKNKTKKNKTLV
jgi:serine/threonine protein kinase